MNTTSNSSAKIKQVISLVIPSALIVAGLIGVAVTMAQHSNGQQSSQTTASTTGAQATIGSSSDQNLSPQSTLSTPLSSPQSDVKKVETVDVGLYSSTITTRINAVQTTLKYPTDQLQFVSIANSPEFPNTVATDTSVPGILKIARAVNSNDASVNGDQLVATVTFNKLKAANVLTLLTIDQGQSFLMDADTNLNILGTGKGSLVLR